MKKLTAWIVLVSLVRLSPVSACCMVPLDYPGTISQNAQQAIVFHHDGREELILRIDYQISGETMPDQFAWVITVPKEPDAYDDANAQVFNQVSRWANRLVTPRPRPQGGGGCGIACSSAPKSASDSAGVIELGRRAKVGPYDIQPVRARGERALEALNAWLKENGFPTEDPKHMKYFIEKEFTFLCIKVTPPEGVEKVQTGGEITPLHLSFESEQLYYPLRFSSRQGVFDLQVVTLTSEPLDYQASSDSLSRINFQSSGLHRNVSVNTQQFPQALGNAYKNRKLQDAPDQWHLNVLRCNNVNENESIDTWKEDIFLATNKDAPVHQASLLSPGMAWLLLFGLGIWVIRQVGVKLRTA